MLERVHARTLPLASRAADHAPMITACCNACRTCVQTNILGLVLGGLAGAGAFVLRLTRRPPAKR